MNDLVTDDNQELQNENSSDSSNGWLLWLLGILGVTTAGVTIHDLWTNHKLKKEREKNALYQEAIRKHQAEIDALKNAKEREEYKNMLWEELRSRSEE